MSEAATDISRGPDGRFASPTPSLPEAASAPAPAAEVASESTTSASSAPNDAKREAARTAFERITQAAPVKDGTGTATAAPPAERENPAATAPTVAAEQTNKPAYAEYDGTLDRKTGDLLKGVDMLLPAADWRAMSRFEQDDHVRVAKELRRQAQAAALQSRQQQTNTGQPLEPEARGARPAVSGQQAAAGVPLPQEIEQGLAEFAETWGADSAEYRTQRKLAETMFGHLQSVQADMQQRDEHQRVEQWRRQLEDSVVAKYADHAPSLRDPQKVEQLRRHARALFVNYQQTGTEITPQEVVDVAIRSLFGPEIQQQQAQKLATARDTTLAGTVQRGTPQQTGKAPAPPDARQRAREAWDRLQRQSA